MGSSDSHSIIQCYQLVQSHRPVRRLNLEAFSLSSTLSAFGVLGFRPQLLPHLLSDVIEAPHVTSIMVAVGYLRFGAQA